MKMKRVVSALLITSGILAIGHASIAANREVTFGSVAMDIPAVMHKRLSPLTRYLGKELGRPVVLRLSPNMGVAIKDTATGVVDLSYLTPVAYIKAHEKGGARVLVKTVTRGKASFRLMIVVRENSPYKTVRDLVLSVTMTILPGR